MEVLTTAFVGSFPDLKLLPKERLPEIAFIGRSNVGKSSLINALLGGKRMALVSSTPGKTRLLNFFRINNDCHFVDLPGYGYAKVAKSQQASWRGMIERYLLGSEHLRLLIQLIDARHGAQANDRQMMEWLHFHHLPHRAVLTKADKLNARQRALLKRDTENPAHELYGALTCSATTGAGMKAVWSAIDAALQGA
jgi:GTP-binding protein